MTAKNVRICHSKTKRSAMRLEVIPVCLLAAAAMAQYFGDYTCDSGRDVFVQLFEWKWSDIEAACPELGHISYCAVQVSPPQEHRVDASSNYPWWQRYQPVSYIVTSRSGDEAAFQSMVNTCNGAGVKIYVDGVINHMTQEGQGVGSAGNFWDGGDNDGGQNYPRVPYSEPDFNGRDMCFSSDMDIHDFQNPDEVRNCRLIGLRDLRLGAEYPRDQVRSYLQKLIDWGVAGFRIDSATYMWPGDLQAVFNGLNGPFFIFQEVVGPGGPITADNYTHIGRVTEFKYGLDLGSVVRKQYDQKLSHLENFGEEWGLIPGTSAVAFVDNHDNQRGHHRQSMIITHREPKLYKIANSFMLAWNYGYPRVMSSYAISDNHDEGPPSDGNGSTNDVNCSGNDWICEHSWRQIANMVGFHNAVAGEPVSHWWDNGEHAIAFGRGNKGFIVINNEVFGINQTFQTGLPPGEYCDVNSCNRKSPPCDGSECRGSITIDGSGYANIDVINDENPIRAYHI